MRRTFELDDQHDFARLSGDTNPVHVDAVAARRTLFGGPIVHGIHALLWALDEALAVVATGRSATRLRALFKTPIRVGQPVDVRVRVNQPERTRVEVEAEGKPAIRLRVDWAPRRTDAPVPVSTELPPTTTARDRDLSAIEGAGGRLDLHLPAEAARRFPRVAERLGPHRLAALLASTRLVGMECPGLHSIYSELAVDFATAEADSPVLEWSTSGVDPRVSQVRLRATAPGFAAGITSFLRPSPQIQPDFASVRNAVASDAFAGQRALVVGGSRGLGEVVAKLVAAGGARVIITYQRGREDALRVVQDIRSGGGQADAIEFDVLGATTPRLPTGFTPSHLYYMATPPILASEGEAFDVARYEALSRFYVDGFRSLIEWMCGAVREGPSRILYPSSIYVEERPGAFREYGAAKAAGEALCGELAKTHGLHITTPRLPRMATDQTASLTAAPGLDPVTVLLDLLLDLA